nr:hypothetical protein CFP56_52970 [Quercus suber]
MTINNCPKGEQSTTVFNYENRCNESIWLGSTPAIRDVLDPAFTSGTSNTLQMGMVSSGGEPSAASMTQIIFHVKLEIVATKFANDQ